MSEYRGPLFWLDPTPSERARAWIKFWLWWKPVSLMIPLRWIVNLRRRCQKEIALWVFSSAWLEYEIAAGRAR